MTSIECDSCFFWDMDGILDCYCEVIDLKQKMGSMWWPLYVALLATFIAGLAACKDDSSSGEQGAPASDPLMVPVYPSLELSSVAETSWSSCAWDNDKGEYLFQIWTFGKESLEIKTRWHADTDMDCSGMSIGSPARIVYLPLEDHRRRLAVGWRNSDGSEIDNGDAPQSADMLGLLPGQPEVRRTKLLFKFYYGAGPAPFSALYQIMFLDMSAAGPRLYVGSPSGSSDGDGFPRYLNNFGVFTPYIE